MEYETIRIEKSVEDPSVRDELAEKHMTDPPKVAVISCDGSSVRGEMARRAANLVAFRLAPDSTVRICLCNAFSRDRGQRELVRRAETVIAFEGCEHNCASRMMAGLVAGLPAEIVRVDEYFTERHSLEKYPDELITIHANRIAAQVMEKNMIPTGSVVQSL